MAKRHSWPRQGSRESDPRYHTCYGRRAREEANTNALPRVMGDWMRTSVLVLVLLSGVVGCKGKGAQKGDLTVTGSPTGEVDGQVRVVVAFGRPMVKGDAIGKTVTSPPLTLSPDVPHEAKWQDGKTLVVVATASLP